MLSLSLGIDVAKDKLDVALMRDGKYQPAIFSNDQDGLRRLIKWLKKRKAQSAHVCLESTGRYGDLAAMTLHEHGYKVSVVNPVRIKAYATSQLQRNKTDRQDARVIAHFCATQSPPLWEPPAPEVQELQALVRRIATLKEERTRELNRQQSGITSQAVLDAIESHITFLDEQIAELEQQIRDLFDQHPDLRRQRDLLTSIPGIGDTTAAIFLAEVTDVHRFETAKQLAAYAGLSPHRHESGSSIHRRGRLSKIGNVRFRTAFYMPALAAMRFNPVIKTFVTRLEGNGKNRMTIVGAVMRKLVHLAYGILKHQQPFAPNYLDNVQVTA